jgi:hypothetical protein
MTKPTGKNPINQTVKMAINRILNKRKPLKPKVRLFRSIKELMREGK